MARPRDTARTETTQRVQIAFGERLRTARRNAPPPMRTQEALAKALKVTRTSISNIERGRHRVFLDQVFLAARALQLPIADLLPSLEDVFEPRTLVTFAESDVVEASAKLISEIARQLQLGMTTKPKRATLRSKDRSTRSLR